MAQRNPLAILLSGALIMMVAGGCAGSGSDCDDGADNDGDGLIDRADPACAVGDTEAPDPDFPACSDGVDNDGDGAIDTMDPGCTDASDDDEFNNPIAQCRDGIDNDGDGHIDFPNDPGCGLSLEDSEDDECPDGTTCPKCSNEIDDDDDGATDYPDDLGCNSAADNDEFNADPTICGANVSIQPLPPGGMAAESVLAGGPNDLISNGCGGSGTETAYILTLTEPKAILVSTDFAETTLDTVVYVRSDCREPSTELGCNDDDGVGVSNLFLPRVDPGEYYVIVDAHNQTSMGDYRLQVTEYTPQGEQCNPSNNDCAPGLVCRKLNSSASVETCEMPECSDGLDNDGDTKIDFPDEPGCDDATDNDELDTCPNGGTCPQCSNTVDDDADGVIDYPNDPGCFFAADTNEIDECIPGVEVIPLTGTGATGTTSGTSNFTQSCSFSTTSPEDVYAFQLNRNLLSLSFSTTGSSFDTVLSVRFDQCDTAASEIACEDPGSGGESLSITSPAQGTYFVFVDGDFGSGAYTLGVSGVIPAGDSCNPSDTAFICQSGYYCASSNLCEVAACNDNSDNDTDSKTDWPDDPGCDTPSDNDETDNCPSGAGCPECSNTVDDDMDGVIDYGMDPGCTFAADDNELDCDGETDPVDSIAAPSTSGTTVGLTNDFQPSCAFSTSGPEVVYSLNVPGKLNTLRVDTIGSSLDTIINVKPDDCSTADIGCNDEGDGPFGTSSLDLTNIDPGLYFIFVDGYSGGAGDYTLNVSGVIAAGEPCDSAQVSAGIFACESGFTCNGSSCVPAVCNNSTDDDTDGKTDYPNDPGCTDPSDNDETDNCPSGAGCPQCGNAMDDDGDGLMDFGNDPGCMSAGDNLELDECIAGVQVAELVDAGVTGQTPPSADGSNFTPSCHTSTLSTEDVWAYLVNRDLASVTFSTVGSTGDTVTSVRFDDCGTASAEVGCQNVQNGGEDVTVNNPVMGSYYYIFVDGDFISQIDYVLNVSGTISGGSPCTQGDMQFVCEPGFICGGGNTCIASQCNDTIDNDTDGKVDDADPGCMTLSDNSETPDPNPLPECADMTDNDGDGLTDFPADTGCERAADDMELNCTDSDAIVDLASTPVSGSTTGKTNDFVPSCSSTSTAPEIAHEISFPGDLQTLTVDTNGSTLDTVLYVRQQDCSSSDLACDDDGGTGTQSLITLTDVAAGVYFIIVDGFSSGAGNYTLNVSGIVKAGEACDMAQITAGIVSCAGGTSCAAGTCQ